MKRNIYLLFMFILGVNMIINAKPVTPATAQTLAQSFIKQTVTGKYSVESLLYTEKSAKGTSLYYIFNLAPKGFIIISADDAAHPIIGYSTTSNYVTPEKGTPIGTWMGLRKKELTSIETINAVANDETTREWAGDFSTALNYRSGNQSTQTVAALCQTTWNQNGGGSVPYNNLCPGGSVTGCVATAMSQIMRFWSYPAQGTGSSSYCDCTSGGFSNQYGTLSANYGATTYSWSAMPLTSSNANVALISSHAGISVNMDYSPSGSGAYVITGDDPICAQASYVNYFKYDPTTIQGLYRSAYTDPNWITLLENELNIGRPIQYVGTDPSQGGHTWVCDGYDASNNFHMNWGWGGYDDGFFSINNLLTTNGGFNPSTDHEALIGIKPMITAANDAGIASVISPTGSACTASFSPVVKLENFGSAALTSVTINYQIDANAVQTYSWTGNLATTAAVNVTLPTFTTTAGTHTLTSSTSNPNGSTDGNSGNDQSTSTFVSSTVVSTLPVVQGFESATTLPSGWTVGNPDNDAAWVVSTTVAHTGTHCVGFDNCDGDGSADMTGKKDWLYTVTYDFSSSTSGNMSFDVGYVPANDGTATYTDTLIVYYSTNCGTTWNQVYRKGGMTLATAPVFTITSTVNCNAPTSSQWRTESINLSSVAGQPAVMFAFENISDWGNWIYLDNINITANSTTGIASVSTEGFNIYPNPASSSFTIEGSDHTGKMHYAIYNMAGQEVMGGDIDANANNFKQSISIVDLAHGMYFVKLNDEKNSWVKKVSVQ